MKKLIRSYLPDSDSLRRNRWLAPFADSLGPDRDREATCYCG